MLLIPRRTKSAGSVLAAFNAACDCVGPAGAIPLAGYSPEADLRLVGSIVFGVANCALSALYRFRKC